MKIFKDKSGKEVKTGDLIVYGHALGRCSGMRYGKVLSVQVSRIRYETKKFHATIWGVDEDSSKPKLLSKRSTLQFGERTLVLFRDQVPENILKLLDSVPYEDSSLA
jgi:hypothetical protein